MLHKAYGFDFAGFEKELKFILFNALQNNIVESLVEFVEINIHSLTDPYEGEKLDAEWQGCLENNDVHEIGDFTLTKFYQVSSDNGLSESWGEITSQYPNINQYLLGKPFGPANNLFDPGKMGSYFQTPLELNVSIQELSVVKDACLQKYLSFLKSCIKNNTGIYVTF